MNQITADGFAASSYLIVDK